MNRLFIKNWLIIAIAISFSVTSYAADFQVGGISYKIKSLQDQTCIVTSPGEYETVATTLQFGGGSISHRRPNKNLYSGNIIIPQNPEYKGRKLTVVGIDNCAFYMCEDLISISIPSSVEYIGDLAFYECENLVKINGDIYASIGSAAFYGCKSLSKINLKKCEFISHQAFQYCSNLTEVLIPGMTKRIGEEAFAACGNLSNVKFLDGSSSITLYMDVFDGSPITNLYLGRNIAFYSNSAHRKPFDNIVHLIIGDSVSSLNEGITLYNVSGFGFGFDQLLNELEEAYKSVFDLSELKTIEIGKSLKKTPAFEVAKLQRITCHSQYPPSVDGNFSYYIILNASLFVPSGAANAYRAVTPWKDFAIKEQSMQ